MLGLTALSRITEEFIKNYWVHWRFDTDNMGVASNLIWYHTKIIWLDVTQKYKWKKRTSTNRLMHTYEYISTLPVMCSTQVSLLDWMNKSLISKIHLTQVCNIFGFQNYSLTKSHTCRFDSKRLSVCET